MFRNILPSNAKVILSVHRKSQWRETTFRNKVFLYCSCLSRVLFSQQVLAMILAKLLAIFGGWFGEKIQIPENSNFEAYNYIKENNHNVQERDEKWSESDSRETIRTLIHLEENLREFRSVCSWSLREAGRLRQFGSLYRNLGSWFLRYYAAIVCTIVFIHSEKERHGQSEKTCLFLLVQQKCWTTVTGVPGRCTT